ncbi:hypothetical protein SUGI_0646750 [Cryptomeria japonica]|nr:hypothetical protein SUGI_0646750 [Cryptomeria japonica]
MALIPIKRRETYSLNNIHYTVLPHTWLHTCIYRIIFSWETKSWENPKHLVTVGLHIPNKEQVAELAKGLEESHVPFLWVLRSPRYNDDSTSSAEERARALLPEGFEERTRERGVVYCKWAPQQQILCHSSTGGFVSHCGWSSVLEAVKFGVKIIALPMHIIQGLDGRLVAEELCIGMEIGREEDGSFRAEEIRRCVRYVMVGEEGRRVAENMDKVREKLFGEEEIQEKYIRELIKHLV